MASDTAGPASLTAAQAAARLGVKRETLYAYVSRGLLRSHPSPSGGRGRLFLTDEVDRLRAGPGTRRATRPGHALEIASSVASLQGGRLRYRGHELVELAGPVRFEAVAELLWTGVLDVEAGPWPPPPEVAAGVAALVGALPAGSGPADRLRAGVVGAAAADHLRDDLRPEAVGGTGRGLLALLAAVGGPHGLHGGPAAASPSWVAERLAASLGLGSAWADALDTALVCLADHELATSTLAARVAASTRADPYACVLAGLAAVSGPLHGSASAQVVRLLREVAGGDGARRAVAARWREGARLPGFGHPLYPEGDPRARVVDAAARRAAPGAGAWEVVDEVLAAASARAPLAPNVDWALGSLVFVADLPADSGEAIFSLARVSGWLAHVIEEYDAPPLRYRVTAVAPGGPG